MASPGIWGKNSTTDSNAPYIIFLSKIYLSYMFMYTSIHEDLFIHIHTQIPFSHEENKKTKKPFTKSLY